MLYSRFAYFLAIIKEYEDGDRISRALALGKESQIARVVSRRRHSVPGDSDGDADLRPRPGHARAGAERGFAAGDPRSGQPIGRFFEYFEEPRPRRRKYFDHTSHREAQSGENSAQRA